MKSIRIGNDIRIEWPIVLSGDVEKLQDLDLTVEVRPSAKIIDTHNYADAPKPRKVTVMMNGGITCRPDIGDGKEHCRPRPCPPHPHRPVPPAPVRLPYHIEDNTLIAMWTADRQFATGDYDIILYAHKNEGGQAVCDQYRFVRLVSHTAEADAPDDSGIEAVIAMQPVTLELSGLSAYEVAVVNGFQGTEEEWLQSLKQPAIDAAEQAKEDIEQFKTETKAELKEDIDNLNANTGVDEYPAFSESTAYSAGDIVNYNGKLYKFTADHVAGAWNGDDVEETDIVKTRIVQELGDSENVVISQKCVFSILCALANGINGYIYNTLGTINPTNGIIQSSRLGNYVTDFLLLQADQVLVIGYASEATACLAFYDENYSFISSVYGDDNNGKLLLVDVPQNAVYCRACGQENKRFVYTKTTEKFQQIYNSITFLNVSEKYPLENSNFYTLQTAREKVPLAERKRGHIISFQSGNQKWEYWFWFGTTDRNDTETGWNNDDLWYKISVDTAITNVTKEFPLSDGYYTLQTARTAIPTSRRRSGHIIMFQSSSQKYELWQWIGNSDRNDTETGWNSDILWKRIPYFDEFDKVFLNNKILEEDILDLSKEIVLTDSGYINYQTGNIGTDSSVSAYTKDYIDCYEADYIIQSMTTGNAANAVGIAFYDENKTYVSGENRPIVIGDFVREIKKIKVPDNACYFRTSYYDLSHRIQLGEFICIVVRNKYPDKNAYKKEYLTQDEICDFYAIDGTTGEKVSSSALGCTRYVDVLSEKALYLPVLQITNDNLGYAFYDIDKNYISGGSQKGNNDFTYKKVEVPQNAVYVRFSGRTYAWLKTNNYLNRDEISVPCGYLPNGKRPYQDGLIFFSVRVNQKINKYWDTTVVDSTDDDYEYTTGVLILPENYTQTGKPVPLIMYCHGYSHGVWYDHWGDTDTFLQQKEYWASKGYAVFDCNGARNNNMTANFVSAGCNQFVEGYRKCYEYIVKHYNVNKNIFVIGGSAGGPTAINYAYTWAKEVRALALFAAWTDIKTCAWGQGQKSSFVEYMGFENTETYEDEKTIGFDPMLRVFTIGDKDYAHIPVPTKAWIGKLENSAVYYEPLHKFIGACRNMGCEASICEKDGLGHEIVSGHIICIDNEVLDWFKSY